MIYDPQDLNMAMGEDGTLYYRTTELGDPNACAPEWAPLHEIKKPTEEPFTRPAW